MVRIKRALFDRALNDPFSRDAKENKDAPYLNFQYF